MKDRNLKASKISNSGLSSGLHLDFLRSPKAEIIENRDNLCFNGDSYTFYSFADKESCRDCIYCNCDPS